ncbi:hypothetical protein CRENBAI_018273 [Crenichthys baileyi]|uniref:Uncharacterized protein n=1 Tax=Crenichthys baileyi TaxID=28760 RepID=A0AAV9RXU8_9TELE
MIFVRNQVISRGILKFFHSTEHFINQAIHQGEHPQMNTSEPPDGEQAEAAALTVCGFLGLPINMLAVVLWTEVLTVVLLSRHYGSAGHQDEKWSQTENSPCV